MHMENARNGPLTFDEALITSLAPGVSGQRQGRTMESAPNHPIMGNCSFKVVCRWLGAKHINELSITDDKIFLMESFFARFTWWKDISILLQYMIKLMFFILFSYDQSDL